MIVSSHVLDEVERFGSRVLVLAQGRLAAEGDFHAIRELMDDRPHRIRVRADKPRALASGLLGGDGVVAVRLDGDDTVIVDTVDASRFRRAIAQTATDVDARLYEVMPLDDDLESVFRYLVGSMIGAAVPPDAPEPAHPRTRLRPAGSRSDRHRDGPDDRRVGRW